MNAIYTPDRRLTSESSSRHYRELEAIVGTEGMNRIEEIDPTYQNRISQALLPQTAISAVISPNTQAELAAVIAYANEHQLGILTAGNSSKLHWGGLVKDVNFLVSTQRLNQLIEHAVGDLTVTVEAGMPFAQLQEILAKERQFLAIDPAYPETATLGGIIATGDTGSLRHRYRGVRDMILGISFVRSDGNIAKAGGRVVKNVAGYDLMKLLTGSYGTLGMISQVTMRVYPMVETSGTVVLTGVADAIAQATQTVLSSALTPIAVDVLSPQLVEDLELGTGTGLMVRFQSIAESVEQQSQRVLEVGKKLGLQGESYRENEANLWQQLKQQIWQTGAEPQIICKIGVRPTEAIATLTQSQAVGLIHAGVGVGTVRFNANALETVLELRRWCNSQGGFLSILDAPSELKQKLDVWGYHGNALDLMRRIKQQFDPKTLFSPNRFIGGI